MKARVFLNKLTAFLLTFAVCVTFSGCTKKSVKESTLNAENSTTIEAISPDEAFTKRDLSGKYDESEATCITLDEDKILVDGDGVDVSDSTATITKEGTYIVSGTITEGQLQVNVGDEEKVQLVLDGVNISCESTAPIYVLNADKVFVTLAEGSENNLEVTKEFVQIDDNNIDGVIFAKDDITINGSGTLDISSVSGHGIVCKNDLKITGGTIDITSAEDGLQGEDSVRIADGTVTLNAGDDGIHSDGNLLIIGGTVNVTESEEGLEGQIITITDGDITVVAKDDGLNATSGSSSSGDAGTTKMQEFGDMDNAGTPPEMGENGGTPPDMTDGERLKGHGFRGDMASGDGRAFKKEMGSKDAREFKNNMASGNAKGFGGGMMDSDESAVINISGGTINIDAGGDGVDSNGYINISGGEIYVSGPTNNGNASLDYGISATITGGVVVMAGSSGMAENFSDDSTQGVILANVDNQSEDATITLTDSSGNEIVSYTPLKSYNSVIISSPEITSGSTYLLTTGQTETSITMDSLIYGSGTGMSGMMRGGHKGDIGEQL